MTAASLHALAAQARAMELQLFDQARPPASRSATYRILQGNIPIALSAPHAVQQPRTTTEGEASLHRSEPYTGPLAIQLHRATGAWAIYATRTARFDPNRTAEAPFKRRGLPAMQRRGELVLVLDLHGAHQARDFAVAIGTAPLVRAGRAQDIVDLLATRLAAALDGPVLVDPPEFRADGAGTVTSYCWSVLGVPAVQLEISRAYRSPARDPAAYTTLFCTLRDLVLEFVP